MSSTTLRIPRALLPAGLQLIPSLQPTDCHTNPLEPLTRQSLNQTFHFFVTHSIGVARSNLAQATTDPPRQDLTTLLQPSRRLLTTAKPLGLKLKLPMKRLDPNRALTIPIVIS
ncbi:MAG: hypothetical protein SF097_11610 [Acidobacteriota bacterium]|nr:hypothetical protein [Acidobacteriota bacterium]